MRSGLHGHPAKPIPGGLHETRASHSTREDADCVCIRVGEQVSGMYSQAFGSPSSLFVVIPRAPLLVNICLLQVLVGPALRHAQVRTRCAESRDSLGGFVSRRAADCRHKVARSYLPGRGSNPRAAHTSRCSRSLRNAGASVSGSYLAAAGSRTRSRAAVGSRVGLWPVPLGRCGTHAIWWPCSAPDGEAARRLHPNLRARGRRPTRRTLVATVVGPTPVRC
jgi:hypothetical protein